MNCEGCKRGKALESGEEILVVVRFKNYVKAGSLSGAYELNQRKEQYCRRRYEWLSFRTA